ncbi:MAG TPA: cation:proton antiporter [Chthoniobacterales bacterium]
MHDLAFLQDLSLVMIVAALATILFRQFKQPVVLGYILAGFVIGPHTPAMFGFISDEENIQTLAELGVIFLMFALGLEFSLRKLKAVGATAFIAAALEILLMIWAGYQLGLAFGWSQMDAIFLGAILSISSTTIIIKALEGLGKTKERFASLIFGILIVEDILAIVMIALLSGFATTGEFVAREIGMTIVGLCSFLGGLLVVGLIAVPRLLNYVAKFRSNEMLLVTVVGLCFGVSLLTVKLGYSVALGAFLIGAIIAEARQIAKVEALMHPVRDLFSAVFFVSIGLLIDPALIAKYAVPIVLITAVVVAGKVITCSLGCLAAGNDMRTSMRVGMGLAQIGEFSFIIASLGLTLKVTSDFIYPIAVAVSAVTTLLTPYLIKSSDGLVAWFDRVAPRPVVDVVDAYSKWVGAIGEKRSSSMATKILGKLAWQIALNFLLATGVFIAAVVIHARYGAQWDDGFPGGRDSLKATIWLAALLVSFPCLIAIWRKIQAGGMMIAELSVSPKTAGSNTSALRAMISGMVLLVGSGVMLVWLLVLSATLMPSWKTLLAASGIALVVGILLYRAAVKLYARAQFALHDTFAQEPDPDDHPLAVKIPSLLREAKLDAVKIPADAVAVGSMISELKLRSETGASIVGIERGGTSVINPPPEEEILVDDEVMLLGSPQQLASARALLLRSA